jgi:AcrR family transcriptional regulator
MKISALTEKRKVGRPISFDREAALHKAMVLFWKHGYEATSIADLTREMGLTPPSLYYAYGDKKKLFLDAVDLYLSGPKTSETIIANASSAKNAARELLETSAIAFTGLETPAGCLLASSAISCSDAASDVKSELAKRRLTIEDCLRQKITASIEKGEFQTPVDADALAGHIMAVIQGMSTLARDGAKRDKLLRISNSAIQGWPL